MEMLFCISFKPLFQIHNFHPENDKKHFLPEIFKFSCLK